MSHINTNSSFVSYTLSEDEQLVGSILTELHKQCIRNQISQIAEQKLALKVDPANVQLFIQQESWFDGQLTALRYLLDTSDSAETTLRANAAQQRNLNG